MMSRWTWFDPATGETWEQPRNPDEATTPHQGKGTRSFVRNLAVRDGENSPGMARVILGKRQAEEWRITGNIRDKAQYTALRQWAKKDNKVHLTDDLGRTWLVAISSIEVTEERPKPKSQYRFRYTIMCVVHGRVV